MNKKIIMTLLLCISIFIFAGCDEKEIAGEPAVPEEPAELPPADVEEIVEPTSTPSGGEDTPETAPIAVSEETEEAHAEQPVLAEPDTEVAKDTPHEIVGLMEKAATKTNYKYFYSGGEYFVKDNQVHIILSENVGSKHDNSIYNEVLVDKIEKTAYA